MENEPWQHTIAELVLAATTQKRLTVGILAIRADPRREESLWQSLASYLPPAELRSYEELGLRNATLAALHAALARAAVRCVFAHLSGIAPQAVVLTVAPGGKPRVASSTVHFNVTHTDNSAFVAVCGSAPVGLDAEKVAAKHSLDLEQILPALLTREERQRLQGAPDMERAIGTVWSLKEAAMKCDGMPREAKDLESSPAGGSTFHVRDISRPSHSGWDAYLIDVDPSVALALALPRGLDVPAIRLLTWLN